ncbi:MAG: PH domain-containing protein [Saprospiraceae bacterium]|uniref:PH domain-containing protein n=1 Tax=Candidatus Opimibacter skivensis TaxID=2982028 RepID=A0A9D7XTK1_9BACT|nr:PH domain-containing protein [Candidatus Opimibacter skivensis]
MSIKEELFTNPQLNIQHLPDADLLEMVRLEPAYKTVRYISSALISFIVVFVSWFALTIQFKEWPYSVSLFIFIVLISVWSILYSGIAYRYMGYALREKDISFKSGWLWRSMTTVPFSRVQHCDIKQGLIDRRFGLSRLTIYTAGGQSTDLMIPGLLPDTAERLKSFILKSTEQSTEERV